MDEMNRTNLFQHLVLQGIWVLILIGLGKKPTSQAVDYRSGAIRFGDTYGNQAKGAEVYRREHTYWWWKP